MVIKLQQSHLPAKLPGQTGGNKINGTTSLANKYYFYQANKIPHKRVLKIVFNNFRKLLFIVSDKSCIE